MHLSHNALYLPPQNLHNLSGCFSCSSFLLGITAVPKEIENNAYAKFWGANKVHYGRCASGVYWRRSFFLWPGLRLGKQNARLAISIVN